MTKNFGILEEYELKNNHQKIYNNIEEIENMISETDNEKYPDKHFYTFGRIILENLLISYAQNNEENEYKSLNDMIKEVDKIYYMPSSIRNSLYHVKEYGNRFSHTTRSKEEPYVDNDWLTAINFLRHIFNILKYFLALENKDNKEIIEKKFNFDYTIYNMFKKNVKKEKDTLPNAIIEDETFSSNTKGLFQFIFSNFKILIPPYQRSYTWKKEQVLTFLNDLKEVNKRKKAYYMGSLAISKNKTKRIKRLIDGQQRVTTSLLLIRAFISIYRMTLKKELPNELKKIEREIHNVYWNKNHYNKELETIFIVLTNQKVKNIKSNAYKNYNYILEFLKQYIKDEGNDITELLTTFIHYFVVSVLEINNDVEYEISIFENLNSKGLELSEWDLTKNVIYKRINLDFLERNEREIETKIQNLFVNPAKDIFNDKKFDKLSDFIFFYTRIQYVKYKKEKLQSNKKIYKAFDLIWNESGLPYDIEDFEQLNTVLLKLKKYFEIFAILNDQSFLDPLNSLFPYRLHLKNLKIKDTHFSLVMHIFFENIEWNKYKIKKIDNKYIILDFIKTIDKFVSRLLIVKNEGQSLGKLFDSCIKENINDSFELFLNKIQNKIDNRLSLPSLKEFENTLEKKHDWQKEYAFNILRTIKYYNNPLFRSGKCIIEKKLFLDQIFPKKPSNKLRKNSELFDTEFIEHVNKIGNYIIMNKKLNSKETNVEFESKKTYYENDYNNIFIYGINNKLMNIMEKNAFDFNDIDKRTNEIAKLAIEYYKFDFE